MILDHLSLITKRKENKEVVRNQKDKENPIEKVPEKVIKEEEKIRDNIVEKEVNHVIENRETKKEIERIDIDQKIVIIIIRLFLW